MLIESLSFHLSQVIFTHRLSSYQMHIYQNRFALLLIKLYSHFFRE